MNIVDDVEA